MSMGRRHWIVLTLAGIAVAAVAFWALQPSPRPVDAARVTRGDLVQRFEEEGRMMLPRRWVLSAPIAGTLRRIEWLQGDAVKAGQVLAVVDPARGVLLDPASRARIEAEQHAAEASLEAAGQRLAAARADADLAERDVRRMRELSTTGAVSVAAREEAEARVARARATVQAAVAEQRAVAQQRAALAAVLGGQGRAGGTAVEIRAPVTGVVLHRYQQSAVPVQAGQALLEIGDLRTLQVMVQALSQQALALRPGTPARILRWGGNQALPARVVRIEPGGFTKISALGVEEQRTQVWLEITAPRAQWRGLGDGFRVEVEFEVARRHDVLQVAASAVFRDGRRWAAYRIEDGRARLVHVELGARADDAVEVLGGLRKGDAVVAFPDDRLRDGLRLRVLGDAPGA
jgi:HlyD family secretion protein